MPYTIQELDDAIRANAGDADVVLALAAEREKMVGAGREQTVSDITKYGPGFAKETGKSAGRGLAALFSLPGNIGQMLPGGTEAPFTGGMKSWPTTEDTLAFLKKHGIDLEGEKHVPGSAEATWDKAVEFGAGSLPGGVATLPLRLGTGAAAGAVGEKASAYADPKQGNQAARLVAEIATLVGPTALMARVPNTVRKAGAELAEQGEAKIRQAAETAKNYAARLGAEFNIGQGVKEKGTSLVAMIEDLLTTRAGTKGRQQMAAQSEKAADEAALLVDKQSSLPGTQETANRIGKAWEAALQAPSKERTEAVRPLYAAADSKAPGNFISNLLDDLAAEQKKRHFHPDSPEGRPFEKLRGSLAKTQNRFDNETERIIAGLEEQLGQSREEVIKLLNSQGKAIQTAGRLKGAQNEAEFGATPVPGMPRVSGRLYPDQVESLRTGAEEATKIARERWNLIPPAQQKVENLVEQFMEAQQGRGPLIESAKPDTLSLANLFRSYTKRAAELEQEGRGTKALGMRGAGSTAMESAEAMSPELVAANRAFRDNSGPVEEIAASVMPRIYKGREKNPQLDRFGKVLGEHPTDVSYAAGKVNAQDPEAIGAIIKDTWGKKLADATEAKGGQAPPTGPGDFVDAIFAGKNGKESARVALEANAAAKGHPDPAKAAKEAIELLEAIQATKNTRGFQGQYARAESQAGGEASTGANVAQAGAIFTIPHMISESISRAVGARTNQKIMDMVMDPRRVEELITLLRTTPGDMKAKALLGALSGLNASESQKY